MSGKRLVISSSSRRRLRTRFLRLGEGWEETVRMGGDDEAPDVGVENSGEAMAVAGEGAAAADRASQEAALAAEAEALCAFSPETIGNLTEGLGGLNAEALAHLAGVCCL